MPQTRRRDQQQPMVCRRGAMEAGGRDLSGGRPDAPAIGPADPSQRTRPAGRFSPGCRGGAGRSNVGVGSAPARRRDLPIGVVLAAVLAVAVLAPATPASAHLGHVVARAERYLKLDVGAGSLRVVVSLSLGAAEMVKVLRAGDRNADGRLEEDEAQGYLRMWAGGLAEEVKVEIDGRSLDLTWADGFLEPVGPVIASAGTVEMVGTAVVPVGDHQLVLLDRMPSGAFDRTDVVFQGRDGARVLASGVGPAPTEKVRALTLTRSNIASFAHARAPALAGQEEGVTGAGGLLLGMRVRIPVGEAAAPDSGDGAAPARGIAVMLIAVVLIVAAALGWWSWRRRRRS